MKTCALIILAFTLSCCLLFAKIKNGYEIQLYDSYRSLRNLQLELLKDRLTDAQRRKLKSCLASIQNYILYHRLTGELIHQLRTVCPDIYHDIEMITDKQHRPTDVYIKLIPKDQSLIDLSGTTFFQQTASDKDRHLSEYGEGTVSVKVWITQDALRILCHELGHVKYVVPNLARYVEFYNTHYRHSGIKAHEIGHRPGDLSGKGAYEFEQRFRHRYASYLKMGNPTLDSAVDLMQKFRKDPQLLENVLAFFSPGSLTNNFP